MIKAGRQKVIDNELTLDELFYRGTGGSTSIFLGAPIEKYSPSKVGGAEQLRNRRSHRRPSGGRWISSPPEAAFEEFFRKTKTGTAIKLEKPTEADIQKARKRA